MYWRTGKEHLKALSVKSRGECRPIKYSGIKANAPIRQTGGRKATKTQRRLGFSIDDELQTFANSKGQSVGGITRTQ